MRITAYDAVGHIVNSLENTNADIWQDDDGVTWVVRGTDNEIVFTFINDDGTEVVQVFELVGG